MRQKGFVMVFLVIILVIGIISLFAFSVLRNKNNKNLLKNLSGVNNASQVENVGWVERGIAVNGLVADAEVIDLGNEKFRMYYSASPEAGGNLELYSAISNDGITWTKEDGIRKEFSTFPDVVKLSDGRYRLYFQNMGAIKSAVSTDGLSWKDEPGVRIDKNESGFALENVGAGSTVILSDGSFVMVYRGTENKPYGTKKLPNNFTTYYFYATSKDGLKFDKKGLAIDPRNDVFDGFLDGSEWVKWDNQELRLYFWSYKGIYRTFYKDGSFAKPIFEFNNHPEDKSPYPQSVPSDPTLTKINGKWFMYYGQHPKGIYYATPE